MNYISHGLIMKDNSAIIFVTGASRSGTTMLSKILGANSRVMGLKELHYFGGLVDVNRLNEIAGIEESVQLISCILSRNAKGLWGGEPSKDEIERAREIVKDISSSDMTFAQIYSYAVSYLAGKEDKEIVCEQTPRNIFYGKPLLENYPGSKIIHIVRDPRAVLASQKGKWRQRKLGSRKMSALQVLRVWFNYHPLTMSKLWEKATKAAITLSSSDRVRVVRYEDIVESPQVTLEELCNFLGIEFEPEMLNISSMGSSFSKSNTDEKGITKEGLQRWKEKLSRAEIYISEMLTEDCMKQFSYTRSTSGKSYLSILPQLVIYPFHVLGVVITNPGRLLVQLKAISKPGS